MPLSHEIKKFCSLKMFKYKSDIQSSEKLIEFIEFIFEIWEVCNFILLKFWKVVFELINSVTHSWLPCT